MNLIKVTFALLLAASASIASANAVILVPGEACTGLDRLDGSLPVEIICR